MAKCNQLTRLSFKGLRDSRFDCWLFHFHVTTLGKKVLHTNVALSSSDVIDQRAGFI